MDSSANCTAKEEVIGMITKKRAIPGTVSDGNYYRIVVRPKNAFVTFRYHDVGKPGHIQRLSGKRQSGSWDTQAWLISKKDCHIENDKLIPDTNDAKKVIKALGSEPIHIQANMFKAKPRPNVLEEEKPAESQKKAHMRNIQKAKVASSSSWA